MNPKTFDDSQSFECTTVEDDMLLVEQSAFADELYFEIEATCVFLDVCKVRRLNLLLTRWLAEVDAG